MEPRIHTHPLPPGFIWQEYPKHRHHLVHGHKHVNNEAEEAKFTPDEEGWVDDLQELASRGVISSDVEEKPKRRGRTAVSTD